MVSAVLAPKLGSGFRCAESAGKPPVTTPGPERVVLSIWTSPLLLTRTRPAVERFRGSSLSLWGAAADLPGATPRPLSGLIGEDLCAPSASLLGRKANPSCAGFTLRGGALCVHSQVNAPPALVPVPRQSPSACATGRARETDAIARCRSARSEP